MAIAKPFVTQLKYGASSSILILDYDLIKRKFKVIKRVEVPRAEYSYDAAVNLIVELNDQYNPAWIYCDSGAGEYQIERLHIIGEERPSTGLRNKVKRMNFKQSLDVTDPVTFEVTRQPMKPFMVTQLQIAFEREMMILSPFDEVLHKQLIDYSVEKIGANGQPVFTSENEHFIDALGLANLAFVLEFPRLTDVIKEVETQTIISHTNRSLGQVGLNHLFDSFETSAIPTGYHKEINKVLNQDPTERGSDRQRYVKVPTSYRTGMQSRSSWGNRSNSVRGGSYGRSMW